MDGDGRAEAMDRIRKRLGDVENILADLMYEEDHEEREGLVRVGMDKVYAVLADLQKVIRLDGRTADDDGEVI